MISVSMSNVQLTGKELTVVYRDLDGGRILSFGIAGAPPIHVPPGIRYETIPCLHARDLDRFMDQYRQQHIDDEERAAVDKLQRESGFRKSVRDAVIARNVHLDAFNQDVNLRMLDAQDKIYDRILNQRLRAIPRLAAEMYDQGGDDTKIVKDARRGGLTQ
jgi:hypothetical protein